MPTKCAASGILFPNGQQAFEARSGEAQRSVHSIRAKMIVAFVACMLAALIALLASDNVFIGKVIDDNSNYVVELSTQKLAGDIDKKMLAVRQSTDALYQYTQQVAWKNASWFSNDHDTDFFVELMKSYSEQEAKNTYGAISAYLALNPETFGYKRGFFLTRPSRDGDLEFVPMTDMSLYEPDDIEHVGWYYVPIEQGEPTWMQPYFNRNIDVWMISYVIPMYDSFGKVLGVVGMDLDFDLIVNSISEGASFSANSSAVLFDDQGELLYRKGYDPSDPFPEGTGDIDVLRSAVTESAESGQAVDADWGEGVSRVFAHQLTNGMTLASIVPLSDMKKPMIDRLLMSACLALAILIASVFVVIVLSRTITRPLRELSDAASEISAGNMDVSIECKGNDEVDALAAAFQTMVGELNIRMDQMNLMAFVDSLTGLGSRAAYSATVDTLKPEIERGTADFTFALIDVNYLKVANDDHGHDAGDALLQDAASVCVDVFGKGHVFRFGGDEFAVVAPGTRHLAPEYWASRIEGAVAAFNEGQRDAEGCYTRPYRAPLSVAWGTVAFEPARHKSFGDVFNQADALMYDCKKEQKSGR